MSQSHVQVYLHIIFSTKNRAPFLKDPAFRERTNAYLAGICQKMEFSPLRVGGVEDHVHLLCRMSEEDRLGRISPRS